MGVKFRPLFRIFEFRTVVYIAKQTSWSENMNCR